MRDLPGSWNFRDVADSTGLLRAGRLWRSGELSELLDAGRDELSHVGVTEVVDLRSRREVQRHGPGRVPGGVRIHLLPIPDVELDDTAPDGAAPHEQAFKRLLEDKPGDESVEAAANRHMVDEYSRFPTYTGAPYAVHRVISLLGEGRTVLTHCFAGKDRTGFVVALVLEAAGIDRDVIVEDYLRSNEAVPRLREKILESVQQRTDVEVTPDLLAVTEARLADDVLGVRAEYLASAWRAIDEKFGSVDGYLREIGVSDADLQQLRGALFS